jgi:putative peptidoglycan lipid II flippase
MGLNLALIFPLQHAGLALATSLAAYLNAYLLWRGLRRDAVYVPDGRWPRLTLQVAAATAVMVVLLWLIIPGLSSWFEAGRLERITWLVGGIAAGALGYAVVLLLTGMRPADLRAQRSQGMD